MLLFHTHTKLKMVDDEPLPLTSYVHFANGIAKVDRYGRRTPPMHKTKKNSKPLLCILCSLARLHSTYIQFDCYKNSCFMHLHASAMYLIVHEFSIAPFKKKQNAQRHTQKVKKNPPTQNKNAHAFSKPTLIFAPIVGRRPNLWIYCVGVLSIFIN